MLAAEGGLVDIVQDPLAGGHESVLDRHGLAALGIAPEHLTGTLADVIHVQLPQHAFCLGTAAGMDVNGVHAHNGFNEAGPCAAHRADGAHLGRILIESDHAGNAALHIELEDHIGIRRAVLGHGVVDVVQHHRNGPGIDKRFILQRLAGQGIDNRVRHRLRFGFRLGLRLDIGIRRFGIHSIAGRLLFRCLLLLITAGAAAQQSQRSQNTAENSFPHK